jgi:hypothetical protein
MAWTRLGYRRTRRRRTLAQSAVFHFLAATSPLAVAVAAASLSVARKRTRTGRRETSSWFRENKASLEAADTAADRGNEGQAAANLPHDAINNGQPETAAGTDR